MHRLFPSLILFGYVLTGCSSLVSPYSTTFQCPDVDKGKCVSVSAAYDESVDNPLVKDREPTDAESKKIPKSSSPSSETASYQGQKYKKLAALIDAPTPPLVAPPQVMRVLILSYTGSENQMFGHRFIYFFATEPQWIFSTATDGGSQP